MKQTIVTVITCVVVCGVLVCGMCGVSPDVLGAIGRQTVMLSVGLRQPVVGKQLLEYEQQMQEAHADSVQAVTLSAVVARPVAGNDTTAPPKQAGGGVVQTQQLPAGDTSAGVAFKNNSKQTVDMAAILKRPSAVTVQENSTDVQVLITHTHTTECYLGYDAGYYNPDDATRTTDRDSNMIAVGARVAQVLKQAGIGVIHDTAIHDQPYSGAYGHSKTSVQAYLEQNPSICVVIDIHRDAIYPSDGVRVKPTTVIDGKKAAQLMLVVGMMNTEKSPNPHTQDNLAFAAQLQQHLHSQYPTLMRPLTLANARYNQQLSTGMILLEVGSDANTLSEACYSAELFAEELVKVLRKG